MKYEISRLKCFKQYALTCEVEPVLQEVTGEVLSRGFNKAPDARLDIRTRGFWEREQPAFFDVSVCHPNADSYENLTPKQIQTTREENAFVLFHSLGDRTGYIYVTCIYNYWRLCPKNVSAIIAVSPNY